MRSSTSFTSLTAFLSLLALIAGQTLDSIKVDLPTFVGIESVNSFGTGCETNSTTLELAANNTMNLRTLGMISLKGPSSSANEASKTCIVEITFQHTSGE